MNVEIKRVIGEGDHVVTHSRFTVPGAPETAANDNTMF